MRIILFYFFSYSVRAGTSNYSVVTEFTQTRRISNILRHPNFNRDNGIYFDVGIAVVDEKFFYSDYIRPICLPLHPVDTMDYLTGDQIIFTGWGVSSSSQAYVGKFKIKKMKVSKIPFTLVFKSENFW